MSNAFETVAKQVKEYNYRCSACGGDRECACSAPAIPKAERAAEAIKAHPEKSNRAIAEETGLSEATVRRARASSDAPESVTGKDGKSYPAKRNADPLEDPGEDDDYEIDISRKQSFIKNAKAAEELGSYEGAIDDEMQEAAGAAADAWAHFAGNNTKWRTKSDGYLDLLKEVHELEDRIHRLIEAMKAKETKDGREWPADMTPKQIKKREKCLQAIAWWQRDLEQLYGEVTGQRSPRQRPTLWYARRGGIVLCRRCSQRRLRGRVREE
jgi:hypothetical protein